MCQDSALESLAFNSNVPLTSAVTANSAFLGLLIVLPFFDAKFLKTASDALAGLLAKLPFVDTDFKQWFGSKLFKLLTCDWTEWCFMAAEPGHAFQKGMQVVQKMKDANGQLSQQTFTNLVERQLLGMVDSGLTDNTAIGHAVSSGAREIFYMGQVMSNGELEDWETPKALRSSLWTRFSLTSTPQNQLPKCIAAGAPYIESKTFALSARQTSRCFSRQSLK
eukprot:g13343.t1